VSEILNKELQISQLNSNPESNKIQFFWNKKELEKDRENFNQKYADVLLTQGYVGMKGQNVDI